MCGIVGYVGSKKAISRPQDAVMEHLAMAKKARKLAKSVTVE
jgi:hypothetical protein